MEAPPSTVDGHHQATHRTTRIDLWYPGRMHVSGRVDIFNMVDINLFIVVALKMMVLKLGYTGESELMFYNYLRPLTSLDEGLYALACEEDVRFLATLIRSFKLIEVYIEHGVTVLDSYLRAPRFGATLEDITDALGSIAANRTEKMLLLTWHESSETTKEPVCDSVTPSSLPQHDSSTPCKDSVCKSITPRCMPNCILTPPTDESVITYTQLSGVQGVDTQSHVLPTIQSQFSDINLSFVSQQATASQVIDDVMRQLSFDETKLDGEAGFADVARSGVDSSGLSHDESFGVDDLDLNLNEPVNLNVSQVEAQSELPVYEEPDVGPTQEPILAEVSTQEPIVAEVSTQEPIVAEVSTEVPIVEEVETQEFSVEDVVIEDYVSSREDEEDAEQGNGQEDESAPTDGQFFYNDEGIDTVYATEYDVQSSEDTCTNDDDDVDEDFLVNEENEIVELYVDVQLFGISIDLPFDNIGFTNLVPDDVLDERTWMSSMRMFSTVTLTLFCKTDKNDVIRIRARCEEKVHVFTMSQGTGPTGPNCGMEAGPSGSSSPTTQSKKKKNTVKAVQDQLQCELEVQISMGKSFRAKAKAKAKREIRGDYVLQYSMFRDYVVELQSTNPNTTIKIEVERNTDPSLPTRVFQRIYVCLRALKLGFRACKRDLLGFDDAFMKGPFPGQVLVAVGLDSNNGIYPLAYALVEAETKSSWCWFLQCLGDDIDLHPNSNSTFISDRQKVFPVVAGDVVQVLPVKGLSILE
ncbi:putative transposase, mutator type, MULE transposase domain protein [Tanacetum coccineum]